MALKIDFENLRTPGYKQHGAGSESWLGVRRCGISPSSVTPSCLDLSQPLHFPGPCFFLHGKWWGLDGMIFNILRLYDSKPPTELT